MSPPLDLDAVRARYEVAQDNKPGFHHRLWRSSEDVPALLARLDEAEELVEALERLVPECYPCRGTGQIHIANREGHILRAEPCPTCTPARDALARWRGPA